MIKKITINAPIQVLDGDTIRVLRQKIRLHGIDTPEKDQPYGTEAKKLLEKKIQEAKRLRIDILRDDKYNRKVARIYGQYKTKPIDLALFLLRSGLAWEKWSGIRQYRNLQNKAKKKKLGIYQQDNPIPPWKWRSQKKETNSPVGGETIEGGA